MCVYMYVHMFGYKSVHFARNMNAGRVYSLSVILQFVLWQSTVCQGGWGLGLWWGGVGSGFGNEMDAAAENWNFLKGECVTKSLHSDGKMYSNNNNSSARNALIGTTEDEVEKVTAIRTRTTKTTKTSEALLSSCRFCCMCTNIYIHTYICMLLFARFAA